MRISEGTTAQDYIIGEKFLLHKAVYENDIESARSLIQTLCKDDTSSIDKRDMHGNTALHIATMLGQKEIVLLLLNHGADVGILTRDGWDSMHEAICYGNREIILNMIFARHIKVHDIMCERKTHLMNLLSNIDDFYMEVKWEFESWIPFLSKILPSDTCKIYKCGHQLRMDTTLIDFINISFNPMDVSVLFTPQNADSLTIFSNKFRLAKFHNFVNIKKFIRLQTSKISHGDLEKNVNNLIARSVTTEKTSVETITFSIVKSGLFSKQAKMERIGNFNTKTYNISGFRSVTKQRFEHLSAEDAERSKNFVRDLLHSLQTGKFSDHSLNKRENLSPPPKPQLTWTEYKRATSPPILGRPRVETKAEKEYKPTIHMSEDFPLPVKKFVDILEIFTPLKHIKKLHAFCQARLPPGFPVKLKFPLVATICAYVTFEKFEWRKSFPSDLFSVPSDYVPVPCEGGPILSFW